MAKKPDKPVTHSATRSMRIVVTEDDIRKGKPMDPTACAIAQALMRITGVEEVRVHRGMTYIRRGKNWQKFATSAAARMETIVFDRGGTFIPGEYDLHVPPINLTPSKRPSPSKGRSPREARLATRRHTIPGVRRSARAASETED